MYKEQKRNVLQDGDCKGRHCNPEILAKSRLLHQMVF